MRTIFKHIIIAVATVTFLCSCMSSEKRALTMLDNIAFREGIPNYKPIRTIRDSILDTPQDNFTIRKVAQEGWDAFEKETRMLTQAENNLRLSTYWAEGGDKQKAAEIYKQAEHYRNLSEEAAQQAAQAKKTIRELAEQTTGKLIGWRYMHQYSCTVNGHTVTAFMILITDRKTSNVIEYYDPKDDKHLEADAYIACALEEL